MVHTFAERGYQGTRVEDVAAELGISKAGGFWSVLVYWLERTEHLVQENRAPYLVTLIGSYGTDLAAHRINRYMVSEDT